MRLSFFALRLTEQSSENFFIHFCFFSRTFHLEKSAWSDSSHFLFLVICIVRKPESLEGQTCEHCLKSQPPDKRNVQLVDFTTKIEPLARFSAVITSDRIWWTSFSVTKRLRDNSLTTPSAISSAHNGRAGGGELRPSPSGSPSVLHTSGTTQCTNRLNTTHLHGDPQTYILSPPVPTWWLVPTARSGAHRRLQRRITTPTLRISAFLDPNRSHAKRLADNWAPFCIRGQADAYYFKH